MPLTVNTQQLATFPCALLLVLHSLCGAEPPAPPDTITSSEELHAAVDSLRIETIAWRTIDWKYSILEGLKASQEENKPLIFWCHIDLPADDKRC